MYCLCISIFSCLYERIHIFMILLINACKTEKNLHFSLSRGSSSILQLFIYASIVLQNEPQSLHFAQKALPCKSSTPWSVKAPHTVDCTDWACTAASLSPCQRPAPHWICPRCWCSFSHSKSAFFKFRVSLCSFIFRRGSVLTATFENWEELYCWIMSGLILQASFFFFHTPLLATGAQQRDRCSVLQ